MTRKPPKRGIAPNSDENSQKGRLLRAVNGAAEILLTADEDEFENSLREGMALMAQCIGVDRINIWQNQPGEDGLQYVMQFSWLAEVNTSGKIVKPKTGFSYNHTMSGWEAKFLRGECVNGPLSSLSDGERERLEPYGVKSILVIPVYLRDLFWGFVSFDDCHNERTFTEDEVSILRSGNLMMVSSLTRYAAAARIREADEHAKLMLDAMPLCCSLWDENSRLVDCNAAVVNFFELTDKQEYLDKFFLLSPENQPDGKKSTESALEAIDEAYSTGRAGPMEWMHQMLDGTPMPTEVTLVRVRRGEKDIAVGYTRDLREYRKMMKEIDYKGILLHRANDVAAILLNPEMDEFGSDMRQCLSLLARSISADRAYICISYERDGELYFDPLYEWPRLVMSQPENAPREPYYMKMTYGEGRLSSGLCINEIVRNMPPEEQPLFTSRDVLSLLVVPVFLHDQFWGFIGIEDCTHERIFSGDEESLLRTCSFFIANAFLRNEMTHDIQAAVEEAQAASKSKSTFLARMSHEIRTPMNVIAGMTELILREQMPNPIREHVLNVKTASSSMLSLVNDILDFSKIESGSLEIISNEYALTSLINNVLIIIRMRVSEKPIQFIANIDCNIPNRLFGDETRIRQIFLNVLDNAAKYTIEGFISLNITGEIEGDMVILKAEVSDSGVGIREIDIEKLFADFIRVDGEKNKMVQGTGLGLSITKSLCQAMGGNITVKSVHGVGSTFLITIPQKIKSLGEKFAKVSEPETKRVLIYEKRFLYADSIRKSLENLGVDCSIVSHEHEYCEALKGEAPSFVFVASQVAERAGRLAEEFSPDSRLVLLLEYGETAYLDNARTISMPLHSASIANILNDADDGYFFHENGGEIIRFIAPTASILLVDDLNTNLKVAEGLMLPYQMHIDVCGSGEEAVECVQEKRFDVIFMDHMMPGIDGIEASRRIRALDSEDGYYKNVPIIALTANAVSGVKETFLENGMDDFLAKPIDVTKLHGLLEKWIPAEKKEKLMKTKAARPSPKENPVRIEIDGVDVKAGISMTGGTVENYLKTLAIFVLDGAEKMNLIRDCIKRKDLSLYTVYVHAMKSATATIGAWVISYLFKTLEAASLKEDTVFIHENTENTLKETESLLRNVSAVISLNEVKATKESAPEFVESKLSQLKEALSSRDIGEVGDAMRALETVRWGKRAAALFNEISGDVLLINYEEALNLLDELREAFFAEDSE